MAGPVRSSSAAPIFAGPSGQTKADDAAAPTFGPSRSLDFELELGFLIGPGNKLGEPIPIAQAASTLRHDAGQRLEHPRHSAMGISAARPFLAKNFATSMSPWVVSLDALEPFRVPGPMQDPQPLPYLRSEGNGASTSTWRSTCRNGPHGQAAAQIILGRADRMEDLPFVDCLFRRPCFCDCLVCHMGKRQRSPPEGRRR